jgi:predicted ABC-type transport system involved in lysophospholipase L1 biosynthesis ATPase subunit
MKWHQLNATHRLEIHATPIHESSEIQIQVFGKFNDRLTEDLITKCRGLKAGLHYQSFCDHSRNFAQINF